MASMICRMLLFVFILLILRVYSTEAIVTRLNEEQVAGSPPSESDSNQVFIVYMGGVSATTTNAHSGVHLDMLSGVLGSTQAAQESILYSYTNSFNGFAAMFSESQAQSFRDMDEVAFVFPSQMKRLHTTASWEFLGLNFAQGLWPQSDFGSDVIVGVIDTGVWPESESFRDDGLGPIPSKWNGTCETGDQFGPKNCNRKLIGARFYYKGYEAANPPIQRPEYKSARDADGHGTHTSSTAAGRQDRGASFLGLANGTASGGASLGRVAMYKVCWFEYCTEADTLAAFDDAIADGVDIISVSLAEGDPSYIGAIALGSFHAIDNGIVVSCSAGNYGPYNGAIDNTAPWIFTVGANSIDRIFVSTIQLGNGVSYAGQAINTFEMTSSYPLVYGGDIPAANVSSFYSLYCINGSLDASKVRGHIILCYYDFVEVDTTSLLQMGAVGLILVADPSEDIYSNPTIFPYNIPLSIVNNDQANEILQYVNSTRSPRALIHKAVTTFNSSAPLEMAYFSSLGPNPITSNISKPDITAPGVDIIAAWSPVANPTSELGDNRTLNFNIISGTSMSCPHVAGTAALVKSVHPDWSPAAIKSAIMTTATPFAPSINNDTGFDIDLNSGLATGSGQINPTKAADPGLVYNTSTYEYLLFLCSVGYTSSEISLISGSIVTCPENTPTEVDLNYPSIFLTIFSNLSISETVTRTLTNVGNQAADYKVEIVAPTGVNMTVVPSSLSFKAFNDERSYTVHIEAQGPVNFTDFVFGCIVWSDGPQHSVRIPIGVGPYGYSSPLIF